MTRHDSKSDEALIEAIERGDGDAAACLYYRHIDRVHRICCRIVLDSSQAPDCVQEVWMKVFRNLGQFRCERSFATWLNAVAAHTAIDFYRRHKRRRKPASLDETCAESLPAEPTEAGPQYNDATIRREIRVALGQISVNQRTAFVLRYFEEMPLPEIAKVLRCRQGTVRTHIRRCLLSLRVKLADRLNQEVQEHGQ